MAVLSHDYESEDESESFVDCPQYSLAWHFKKLKYCHSCIDDTRKCLATGKYHSLGNKTCSDCEHVTRCKYVPPNKTVPYKYPIHELLAGDFGSQDDNDAVYSTLVFVSELLWTAGKNFRNTTDDMLCDVMSYQPKDIRCKNTVMNMKLSGRCGPTENFQKYCDDHRCMFCERANSHCKIADKRCNFSKMYMCLLCFLDKVIQLQYFTSSELILILLVTCLDIDQEYPFKNGRMYTYTSKIMRLYTIENLGHVEYKEIQFGNRYDETHKLACEMPHSGNYTDLDLWRDHYTKAEVSVNTLYSAISIVDNSRDCRPCSCARGSKICLVTQMRKYFRSIWAELLYRDHDIEFDENAAQKVCKLLKKKTDNHITIFVRPQKTEK